MKNAIWFAALLLSLPAAAQKISVAPFTGPNANNLRNQVLGVCDAADCVGQAKVMNKGKPDWKKAKKEKVTWIVVGKVTAKGKKVSLELQALKGAGAPKWKKVYPVDGKQLSPANATAAEAALMKAMGLKKKSDAPPDEEPPPVVKKKDPPTEETKTDALVEEKPVKKKTPEVTPPPVKDDEETPPEPDPGTPMKRSKPPIVSLEVGVDLQVRVFSYTNLTTLNLRSYSAPVFSPDIKGEFFPLALVMPDSIMSGLGVDFGFAFAVGLKSRRKDSDVAYPTSASRIDFALKFRIQPLDGSDASFSPYIGFRSASFAVGAGSDGSKLEGLPSVSYPSIKIGVMGELPFSDTGLLVYGRFAVMPTLGGGELLSATYFPKGSVLGIDGGLGLGYRIPPIPALQVRLGFDFIRYGIGFTTNPTDTYVAEGAVDQYLGGNFAIRYTY